MTLTEYLQQNGFGGLIKQEQCSYGQSNPTYILEMKNGQKFVLRRKPSGKLLKSAHNIEREYQIMKYLYQKFPVPKMYHYCKDTSVIGQEFFLMEYVEGKKLLFN